jgi:hypothetical protein
MHVFVHAENDLFSSFAEEIQNQIITPIQQRITYVGAQHSPALIEKNINGILVELAMPNANFKMY